MTCIPLALIVVVLAVVAMVWKPSEHTELWKAYALALEVIDECDAELAEEIDGEGCMTRLRRRERILQQRLNARLEALRARKQLEKFGQYV